MLEDRVEDIRDGLKGASGSLALSTLEVERGAIDAPDIDLGTNVYNGKSIDVGVNGGNGGSKR